MSVIATPQSRRAYAVPADDSAPLWLLVVLVLGAMTFNLFLCFANTRFTTVGNLHVIASEVLIVSTVFLVSYSRLETPHVLLIGGMVLFTLALSSVRVAFAMEDMIDVKIVRDLAIPIAFFLLGLRARSAADGDFIVRVAATIVLGLALFEYFSVDGYTQLFNVAKYYIARGTMEAKQALQSADLFISGVRPAGAEGGRNLLPFLGDHRVSSIFLEPVSMGNFGIIVFMWGLVRSKFEHKLYFGLLTMGLAFVVLADSRFGAYFCLMSLAIVMLPSGYSKFVAAVTPFAALLLLVLIPGILTGSYDPQHRYIDNGFVGRIVLSGQILGEFDALNWLALEPLKMQAFDSGYSYILSGIGVVGLAIAWYVLLSLRGPDRQFYAFRDLTAMYYAVILCISNSPFTIKTASLLWFLIGALARGGQARVVHAPRRAMSLVARRVSG